MTTKEYTEMSRDEMSRIINRGGDKKRELDIAVQTHIENIFDELSDKARYIFLNTDCNGLAEVFGGLYTAKDINDYVNESYDDDEFYE